MHKFHISRIKLYLLNFILSLILILIIHFAIDWYNQILQEKAKFNWELLAEQAALFISNNHTYEGLLEKMANKMIDRIQKYLKENNDINANIIINSYKKSFTPKLRSDKWLLYAFKYDETKLKLVPFQNTFFAKDKLTFVSRVFSKITNVHNKCVFDSKTMNLIRREIQILFGEDADERIITFDKKGCIIPIYWNNKLAYMFWDTLAINNKILGTIIIIIPLKSLKISPVKLCIQNIFKKSRGNIIPLLLPLNENNSDIAKFIYPKSLNKSLLDQIIKVIKENNYDNKLPLTMIQTKEFWLMNSFFSYDLPYKLWIISLRKNFIKEFNTYKILLWGSYFLLVFIILFYIIFSDKHYISIRYSLSFTYILVGVIPIAGILGLGLMYFEKLKQNLIHETIRIAKREIDYFSARSNKTFTDLSFEIREIMNEIYSKQNIYLLAKENPQELYSIFQKKIFEKVGIENLIMAIGFPNKTSLILPEYGKFGISYKHQLDIFAPIIVTAHDVYYDSNFYKYESPKLNETQSIWLDILRAIRSDESFSIYFDIEETGEYTQVGILGSMFQVSFKISDHEYIKVYFILRLPFEDFVRKFFIVYLSKKTVSMRENNSYYLALVKNSKLNFVFPDKLNKIWLTQEGRKIQAIIKNCYNSYSENIVIDKNKIYLASYKSDFLPYIISVSVDISEKMKEISVKKFFLLIFAVFCATVVYKLSKVVAENLVEPILEINKNLKRVTAGDLSVQIQYNRHDEIGALAESVNKMIDGLKERKALGYFVSKSLEKNINIAFEKTIFLAKPQKVRGVALFSDIRNFTAISEKNPPEVVVSMLNRHFDEMCEVIDNNGGYLEQFIGDAIVAFFPGDLKVSAYNAVKAALEMRKRHDMKKLEAYRMGLITYEIGIGIAFGEFIIGSMKGVDREFFGLLGEGRDKAEALETLSKFAKNTKILANSYIKETTETHYVWELLQNNIDIDAWELVKEL